MKGEKHMKTKSNSQKWNALKGLSLAAVLLLCGILCSIPAKAAQDIQSSSTIGGVYAYGHTEYTTTYAMARTTHNAVSTKIVGVQGVYVKNDKVERTGFYYQYSYDTNPAYKSVYLPSGAVSFIGSTGYHSVNYNGIVWPVPTVYTTVGVQ